MEAEGTWLIAVSGGVDSRFLAHVAAVWNIPARLVLFTDRHFPRFGLDEARAWLARQPLVWSEEQLGVFDQALTTNPKDRCARCKQAMMAHALQLAQLHGCARVADGSQADDAGKHRPGLEAGRRLGIRSPLLESGLDKEDIRALGREMALSDPDQPSSPCLLTRLAYGFTVTHRWLDTVERTEDALRRAGMKRFRFRVLGRGEYVLQVAEEKNIRPEGVMALLPPGTRVQVTRRISGYFDGPLE